MDIYLVKPGDTIYSIAQKYNVSHERLAYDNNILPNYNIVNGQIIIVPH
jgi:spore germination protein